MSDDERTILTIGAMIVTPLITAILINWLQGRGYW